MLPQFFEKRVCSWQQSLNLCFRPFRKKRKPFKVFNPGQQVRQGYLRMCVLFQKR